MKHFLLLLTDGEGPIYDNLYAYTQSYQNYTNLSSPYFIIAAIYFLFCFYKFSSNLQEIFCSIFSCEKLDSALKEIVYTIRGGFSIFLLVAIICLGATCNLFLQEFGLYEVEIWLKLMLQFIFAFLFVSVLFFVIPSKNECKEYYRWLHIFVAAILLISFWHFFPIFNSFINSNNSNPLIFGDLALLFTVSFWIEFSWMICISIAKACYINSTKEAYYYKEKIKNLTPYIKDCFSLYIASYIYQKESALSIQDIYENTFTGFKPTPKTFIDEILDRLTNKGIIEKKIVEGSNTSFYMPKFDIANATIGDFMHYLYFTGEYNLIYQYDNIINKQEIKLLELHLEAFAKQSTLLKDIFIQPTGSQESSEKVEDDKRYNEKKQKFIRNFYDCIKVGPQYKDALIKVASEEIPGSALLDGLNRLPHSPENEKIIKFLENSTTHSVF